MQNCSSRIQFIQKLCQKNPKHPAEDVVSWMTQWWSTVEKSIVHKWLDKLKVTNLLKFHHNFEPYYPS
jgi:hypothetical protein